MHLLRRYRVGLVLLGLLVAMAVLILYRLDHDQQARAVTRVRPDTVVGVLRPERRTMEVKLAFTAEAHPEARGRGLNVVQGARAGVPGPVVGGAALLIGWRTVVGAVPIAGSAFADFFSPISSGGFWAEVSR